MATSLKNLSSYHPEKVPSAKGYSFAIVVSEWNHEITSVLAEGAIKTLKKHGVDEDDIVVKYVPGSFELSLGAQLLIEHTKSDAVICLGCVVRGETPHFDYICQGVTQGITHVNLEYNTPVIFGVLTTETQEQAADRAGGKHGNKGVEAAITAIKMVALQNELMDGDEEEE